MRHAWRCALGLGILVVGCSRGYESERLAMAWSPPSGVRLLEETQGPPPRATFNDGITWVKLDNFQPSLEEEHLQIALEDALGAAGLEVEGSVLSARVGSLPAGAVARIEVKGETTRQLVYLVPRAGGTLLLRVRAPPGRYGLVSSGVERSLSTLRLR